MPTWTQLPSCRPYRQASGPRGSGHLSQLPRCLHHDYNTATTMGIVLYVWPKGPASYGCMLSVVPSLSVPRPRLKMGQRFTARRRRRPIPSPRTSCLCIRWADNAVVTIRIGPATCDYLYCHHTHIHTHTHAHTLARFPPPSVHFEGIAPVPVSPVIGVVVIVVLTERPMADKHDRSAFPYQQSSCEVGVHITHVTVRQCPSHVQKRTNSARQGKKNIPAEH
jgi:hypothetical protein